MALRLEELGRLRSGTWEQLNQRGFRVRETRERYNVPALGDNFASFSRRYRHLLVRTLAASKISEGEAAKMLETDRLGVRRVVEETLVELGVDELDELQEFDINLMERPK